jgi:Meiotically up-regulated gene 113
MSAAIRMHRLRQKEREQGITRYEVACARELVARLKHPRESISRLMNRALECLDWHEHFGQKYRVFRPDEKYSYVYLFKHGEHYKIGQSKECIVRLKTFNRHLPEEAELVHVIITNDPDFIEKRWFHRLFQEYRVRPNQPDHEWFKLQPMHVQWLRCITKIERVSGGFTLEVGQLFMTLSIHGHD